jgi:hypothetical protein
MSRRTAPETRTGLFDKAFCNDIAIGGFHLTARHDLLVKAHHAEGFNKGFGSCGEEGDQSPILKLVLTAHFQNS